MALCPDLPLLSESCQSGISSCNDLVTASSSAENTKETRLALCFPFSMMVPEKIRFVRMTRTMELVGKKDYPGDECRLIGSWYHISICSSNVTLQGFSFCGTTQSAVSIWVSTKRIKACDCLFEDNIGIYNCALIHTSDYTSLKVEHSVFRVNINSDSGKSGGSIYACLSNLKVMDSLFEDGSAKYGGVIYLSTSMIHLIDFLIEGSMLNNNLVTFSGATIGLKYASYTGGEENSGSGSIENGSTCCYETYITHTSDTPLCVPFALPLPVTPNIQATDPFGITMTHASDAPYPDSTSFSDQDWISK
eukprot:13036702-Ditylum_brightwellii.AAC.1